MLALAPLLLSASPPASVASSPPAQDEAGFQRWLDEFRLIARREGVSARTLDEVLPTLTFNSRVVELDRSQPGGSTSAPGSAVANFAPYRARHVDAARIGRGRTKYRALRPRLAAIERETGVPEAIMVAIWGHETNYGSYTGDFDLPRSLASLAYEGRRRALFQGELIATLKMIDRGIPRSRIKGSWAGATGYPQFLPSVYLRVARDGDGDGRADIWTSEADTLASIANYFVDAGWRPGVPWGAEVTVPNSLDRGDQTNRTVSPRCPRVFERHSRWRSVAEWRALGVRAPAGWRDAELATLIEPDGQARPGFLLTGNYRVILDYNCSNFYALSVGLLADAVER